MILKVAARSWLVIARVLVGKTHARACVILCALLISAVFLRERAQQESRNRSQWSQKRGWVCCHRQWAGLQRARRKKSSKRRMLRRRRPRLARPAEMQTRPLATFSVVCNISAGDKENSTDGSRCLNPPDFRDVSTFPENICKGRKDFHLSCFCRSCVRVMPLAGV